MPDYGQYVLHLGGEESDEAGPYLYQDFNDGFDFHDNIPGGQAYVDFPPAPTLFFEEEGLISLMRKTTRRRKPKPRYFTEAQKAVMEAVFKKGE